MSPGETAYERARRDARLDRAWIDLSDDERATWELGATLPTVRATANLSETADRRR